MAKRRRTTSKLLREAAEIQVCMAEVIEQWAQEDFEEERKRKFHPADTKIMTSWPAVNGKKQEHVSNGKSAAA